MTHDASGTPLRRDRRSAEGHPAPEPVEGPEAAGAATAGPIGRDGITPDIDRPAPSARIPGDPRRPFTRFPTDPIGIVQEVAPAPELDVPAEPVFWEPAPAPAPRPRIAGWALTAAIVALVASWFVGWGVPLAILAVVLAFGALRRPAEPRGVAIWALVLGFCATAFSLGWLVWAAMAWESLG